MSNENTVVRVCQFCGQPFYRQVGAVERHSVGLHYCNRQEYLENVEPVPPERAYGARNPDADLMGCRLLAASVLKQAYIEKDYPYLKSPLTYQFAELIGDIAIRWLHNVLPECTP